MAGERRQLTAMFCDIVGSTDLGQRVDPEELREILSAYHEACSRAIRRFDGHVAQYLGDGLLVYFGYPQAHEDDAERAVRAGLAIRAALAELNQRRAETGTAPIEARIGVHTGLVVVMKIGDPEHQETLALGDTINVAARIQALGESAGILISHATQRLVAGLFVTRDLGTPPLRGVIEPMRVYAVEGSAGIYSRFRVTGGLTPLRGREQELGQLLERWKQTEEGRGQAVSVSGEAGIGKSRLLHELRQQLAETPHFTLELGCSPYTAGSAFQPVIELLKAGAGFSNEDVPEEKLKRLEERLAALRGLRLEEVVPYLAALLELPPSERFPLEHMAPELQREKTLEALLAPIRALATGQPLLMVCEDLHWSDPSTLELLGRLIDEAPKLPILVLMTFRAEFAPPPRLPGPNVGSLLLTRLTKWDTRAVAEAAAGGEGRLPSGVLDQVAERADGVPLFAEELARAVVESGLGRVSELRIPTTLQDSLMARLDRLIEAKPVAQLCATLGRDFSHELIEAVAGTEIPSLDGGLEQLVDAGILHRRGAPPEAAYTFRHALLQSTAYESLLKSARRAIHARIASILEERFPQQVAAEPEVMARHSAEAGSIQQAVGYYQQAGEQAVARLANAEAVEYFIRALELLASLPESPERQLKEIELRLAAAGPRAALHGYDDPDSVRSCERAEQLCEAIGSGPQQLPGLLGLTLYHLNRGHLPKARDCAESLLRVAEPLGVASLRVAGHMIKGTASITTATASEACDDLRKAIEIAATTELESPKAAFEVDALTVAYCTYAIALVLAGRPESAMQASGHGLSRARELGHPRTRGSALANCALASYLMEDAGRTRALTEECLDVVVGRGFHTVECSVRVLRGWARARQADSGSIADLEAGLALASACGTVVSQFHFVAANAYALAGRIDRAFAALKHGAALIERTGEWMYYEPQIPGLRARLLLASGSGGLEQAEALLVESVQLWRRYRSSWMALLSAILLGRLALRTGKREEARTRLAELYRGFSEGLETPQLREARALLDELA